jgi:hypothetical protein
MSVELALAALTESMTDLTGRVTNQAAAWDALVAAEIAALENWRSGALGSNVSAQYFIDAIIGDDANSGLSVAAPVKSWERVTSLIQQNIYTYIFVLSDITADFKRAMFTPPSNLRIFGRDSTGVVSTKRKITLTDSAAASSTVMNLSPPFHFRCLDIDFELAGTSATAAFLFVGGASTIHLTRCTVTKTGVGTGALFEFTGGASANIFGETVVVDPAAAGYVIKGVAAGADPNAAYNLTSNLTSL